MKVKYFAALAAASLIGLGVVTMNTQLSPVQANPCASVDPCAGVNPCASVDPCAAANPCASANPCAAGDPCASVNPCAAGDPCAAANPCASADPCAAASTSEFQQPWVYSDPNSQLAIRGYDPVAYFTEEAPVEGTSAYQYEWRGATWQFASEANMELFAADPEAYAPQYGGYCAKALSEGNLASIDPTAWLIVDGKLYLNYSAAVQQQWLGDVPGNIARADANWPEILNNDVVYE